MFAFASAKVLAGQKMRVPAAAAAAAAETASKMAMETGAGHVQVQGVGQPASHLACPER